MKSLTVAIHATFAAAKSMRLTIAEARAALSQAVDGLDLAHASQRAALDEVVKTDAELQEVARCLDRAELAIAGAALWLREPERMAATPPPGEGEAML